MFDLFHFYRSLLFWALTIYTLVVLALGAWKIAVLLAGDDARQKLLRTYLSYLLSSARISPLLGELAQIAFWTGILCGIWGLHAALA